MRYEDLILKAAWLIPYRACFFRCQEIAIFSSTLRWLTVSPCHSIDCCPSQSPCVLSIKGSDLRKSLRKRQGVCCPWVTWGEKTTLSCCCGYQKEFKIPQKLFYATTVILSHIYRGLTSWGPKEAAPGEDVVIILQSYLSTKKTFNFTEVDVPYAILHDWFLFTAAAFCCSISCPLCPLLFHLSVFNMCP